MGMMNNTTLKVKLNINSVIRAAYRDLAKKGEIPWAHINSNLVPDWDYEWDNPEEKKGLNIVFFVRERSKPEPEKPYQAGDWRDPELNND